MNAGNLDVLLEFTVTIGTLPPDMMFISGGFEFFSAYAAHTVLENIVTGYAARFIDENGNPIDSSAVNLGLGESITVQMTAFAYEAPLNTVTGAFQGFGTIEAEAIPEPASAMLLVGAVGGGLVARRWRLLG